MHFGDGGLAPGGENSPRLEQEVMDLAWRKEIPIAVQLNLTHCCNLSCVHCYCAPDSRPELTTAEVEHLLEELASAGTLMVTWSGGEVCTRWDLVPLLGCALDLRFASKVYTNATLVDDRLADAFAELAVHQVHVSIYSADARVHDSITAEPGSFQRSMAGIDRLLARGVGVKLKCPIMQQNFGSYLSVVELARKMGAMCRLDPIVTARHDGDQAPIVHRLNREQLESVYRQPEVSFYGKDDTLPVESAVTVETLDTPPCSAGLNNCSISPCGDVTPCIAFPLVAGNVREQPFDQIWRYSAVLRQVRATRVRNVRVCSSCPAAAWCTRCPGTAMIEDGDWAGHSHIACEETAAKRAVTRTPNSGRIEPGGSS